MENSETIYKVYSCVAAKFQARLDKLCADINAGKDFTKIASTKQAAIDFIKEWPMDVLEPEDICILETSSFREARAKALKAIKDDWYGATTIYEYSINNSLPSWDRETLIQTWDCCDGQCFGPITTEAE